VEGPGHGKVRALLLALAVLTVVVAAFVLEGVLAKDTGGWPWAFRSPTQLPGVSRVTYVQKYTRCGDTSSSVKEVPSDQVDALVAALAPGWKTKETRDGGLEIEKETDGFCPDHQDYRFIALYRGSPGEPLHVCVFRGKKADPIFLVRERRDLDEEALAPYPKERERLKAGVLVPEPGDPEPGDVDEKVNTYLQGIAEKR
jgi:hypothetical protein